MDLFLHLLKEDRYSETYLTDEYKEVGVGLKRGLTDETRHTLLETRKRICTVQVRDETFVVKKKKLNFLIEVFYFVVEKIGFLTDCLMTIRLNL